MPHLPLRKLLVAGLAFAVLSGIATVVVFSRASSEKPPAPFDPDSMVVPAKVAQALSQASQPVSRIDLTTEGLTLHERYRRVTVHADLGSVETDRPARGIFFDAEDADPHAPARLTRAAAQALQRPVGDLTSLTLFYTRR